MRIERDQRLTLGIGLGLAAAFALALWLPHQVRCARLHARIAEARATLGVDAGAGGGGLPQLAREVGELRRATAAAERYLPPQDELGPLLRQLSSELERLGVIDQELHTRPIARGPRYSMIPVSLRFRGSFATAHGFLRQVESMRRMVRVTGVQLSAAGGDATRLDVRVELCAFSAALREEASP